MLCMSCNICTFIFIFLCIYTQYLHFWICDTVALVPTAASKCNASQSACCACSSMCCLRGGAQLWCPKTSESKQGDGLAELRHGCRRAYCAGGHGSWGMVLQRVLRYGCCSITTGMDPETWVLSADMEILQRILRGF